MADQPSIPESELQVSIEQAKGGDAQAFERVYRHFFPQVYRYCAARLIKEEAEDATADVFVKSWEKLHTYTMKAGVPFAAWLFRIARTTVVDAYRRRVATDEVPEEIVDEDPLSASDHRTRQNADIALVRSALERLPKRYRDVLLLTYIAGLSHSDAAFTLKIREGGLRVLKLRALRKLQALLPDDASSPL